MKCKAEDLVKSLEAYSQITLVANEHDGHVWVGMLPCIFQPASKMIESFPPVGIGLLVMLHGDTILSCSSIPTYLVMSYTSSAPAAPL